MSKLEKRPKQSGYALLVVIASTLIISTIAAGFNSLILLESERLNRNIRDMQKTTVSDALENFSCEEKGDMTLYDDEELFIDKISQCSES